MITFFITLKSFFLFLYVFKYLQTHKKIFTLLHLTRQLKINKVKFNSSTWTHFCHISPSRRLFTRYPFYRLACARPSCSSYDASYCGGGGACHQPSSLPSHRTPQAVPWPQDCLWPSSPGHSTAHWPVTPLPEMCNCFFFFKSITKYIVKDFNFDQLHYQLKQLVKNQLLFNYQLHYQLLKTKRNKKRKIKCRYQYT